MKKQRRTVLFAFSFLLLIAAAIGCGTAGVNFLIPVGGGQVFAFVVNSDPDSSVTELTISAFSIDGSTGAMTPVPGSPFTAPDVDGRGNLFMDVDPNGRFLFVPNRDANSVTVFSIGSNGALTQVGSPTPTGGSDAFAVKVSPDGRFLYVANQSSDDITAFSIGATGTLTQIGDPVSADGDPHHLFMDPQGRFLYAGIWGEGYAINGFAISPTDGSLTYIKSAFILTGDRPQSGTVDSAGNFLLVANNSDWTVSVFQIDQNGGLSEIEGSPFDTGAYPFHVMEFGSGTTRFMAVTNTDDGTLSIFSFNATSGDLTLEDTPDIASFPIGMALDASGRYGYVTDEGNNNIVGVAIDANGQATPISGSPFSGGGISHPAQIVIREQQ